MKKGHITFLNSKTAKKNLLWVKWNNFASS